MNKVDRSNGKADFQYIFIKSKNDNIFNIAKLDIEETTIKCENVKLILKDDMACNIYARLYSNANSQTAIAYNCGNGKVRGKG
jgi:hypothetical protein